MNYIKQLQAKVVSQQRAMTLTDAEMEQFKAFLQSPKFVGEEKGERKDWIATGDVIKRLSEIQKTLREV